MNTDHAVWCAGCAICNLDYCNAMSLVCLTSNLSKFVAVAAIVHRLIVGISVKLANLHDKLIDLLLTAIPLLADTCTVSFIFHWNRKNE